MKARLFFRDGHVVETELNAREHTVDGRIPQAVLLWKDAGAPTAPVRRMRLDVPAWAFSNEVVYREGGLTPYPSKTTRT